jgi:hypothetical protein
MWKIVLIEFLYLFISDLTSTYNLANGINNILVVNNLILHVMKKNITFLILCISCISIYAQTDSTTVDEIRVRTIYCELLGTSALTNKVTVTIDMGEEKGFLGLNTSYIIDEATGKPKKFNSMVDAMNFMGTKGWEFVQAYAITIGSSNVYHFLLKQTVILGEDGQYYPATKKAFGNTQQ